MLCYSAGTQLTTALYAVSRPTSPQGGASWGREMIGAWAAALAAEVDVRCGRKTAQEAEARSLVAAIEVENKLAQHEVCISPKL